MSKLILNNSIVRCRSAVKNTRVFVIRKLVRELKRLNEYKGGKLLAKKKRKAEKLLQAIQVLKHIKPDAVTKYALGHSKEDIDAELKNSVSSSELHATATLARHSLVQQAVGQVLAAVPGGAGEVGELLQALGSKRKDRGTVAVKEDGVRKPKTPEDENSEGKAVRKDRVKKPKPQEEGNSEGKKDRVKKPKAEVVTPPPVVEKIVDSFFVDKKVIAPKLLEETHAPERAGGDKDKFRPKELFVDAFDRRRSKESGVRGRGRGGAGRGGVARVQRAAREAEAPKEELHPSWAAKKVKLIQPFQGKKITFSD